MKYLSSDIEALLGIITSLRLEVADLTRELKKAQSNEAAWKKALDNATEKQGDISIWSGTEGCGSAEEEKN